MTKYRALLLGTTVIVSVNTAGMAFSQAVIDPMVEEFNANWGLRFVGAAEAWARGLTGTGIVIGIADTAMQTDHPEFNGRVIHPDPAPDFPVPGYEVPFHGTHVAGISAAARDGVGMVGVAPDAQIASIVVIEDAGYAMSVDVAQELIDAGVQVMNGSFGPSLFPRRYLNDGSPNPYFIELPYQVVSAAFALRWAENITALADADVVMVFSAGNERDSQPVQARIPAGPGMLPLITPEASRAGELYRVLSDAENYDDPDTWTLLDANDPLLEQYDLSHLAGSLISVVAITGDADGNPQLSSFSDGCDEAARWCISAPGEDIVSSVPDSTYAGYSGTSQAAPFVTGGAALVRQAFPYMTARQVIEVILTTATPIGDENLFGHGLLNVDRATRGPVEFGSDTIFQSVFAVDTEGYDSAWENDISGVGGMRKSGEGVLMLTGNNSYTGATLVDGGALHVAGSIASSALTVASGGTVQGGGVLGTTVVEGHIAPGSFVGTLTVNGDLSFGADAVYHFDIGANGTTDQIIVSGDTMIAEGAMIRASAHGDFSLGRAYSALQSLGSLQGNFSGIDSELLFVDFAHGIDDDTGFVTVTPERNSVAMTNFAQTDNQRSVAAVIDGLDETLSPSAFVLSTDSESDLHRLYDGYSGEIYATQQTETLLHAAEFSKIIERSSRNQSFLGRGGDKPSVWTEAFSVSGTRAGSGAAKEAQTQSSGIVLGAQSELGFGAAIAMTRAETSVSYSTSETTGTQIALYNSTDVGRFQIGGMLSHGRFSSDVSRRHVFSGSSYSSANVSSRVTSADLEIALTPSTEGLGVSWEPFVRTRQSWLSQSGFSETGSDAALQGERATASIGTDTIGVRFNKSWEKSDGLWNLGATARLERHRGDRTSSQTLSFISGGVDFPVVSGGMARTNIGLDVEISRSGKGHKFSLGASGLWSDTGNSQQAQASFSWVF